jgi:hypothetical protein
MLLTCKQYYYELTQLEWAKTKLKQGRYVFSRFIELILKNIFGTNYIYIIYLWTTY